MPFSPLPSVRYNSVARILHWTIALLIITNLVTGLGGDALKPIGNVMPFHKSVGLTVLALSLARLAWRLCWQMPPWPAKMSAFERTAAQAVHGIFYVLMIAMPMTGWIMASTGKYPLNWFGLFGVPKLAVTKGSLLAEIGHEGHELLGWSFLVLLVLHVAAALHHHFVVKDQILRRML